MRACPSCDGFVPRGLPRCPHCDAGIEAEVRPLRLRDKLAFGLMAGSAAMTLMACYGVPCGPDDCFEGDGETDDYEEACDPSTPLEALDGAPPVSVDGMLVAQTGTNAGTCGGRGDEVVYEWTPPADGLYRISVTSEIDTVLYLRAGGGDACGTETACNDDTSGVDPSVTASLSVSPILIVVDSLDVESSGSFTLTIEAL